MASAVVQTVPLGAQWPTLDPFLFCAHHWDHYPESDGSLGPAASLQGRNIGQDFAGIDGWNMYHGSTVPGFPQHPHRGFETVTYVREGWCDHSDSLGDQARFGEGDVQWLTAGSGIVHSEMFPLFETERPNPLHLFQLWLNLPAERKMVDPYFSMLWSKDVPTVQVADDVEVTVIAGDLAEAAAPKPPPDSWAAGDTGVEIWHVKLEPQAFWTLPAPVPGAHRVLYFFEGDELVVGDTELNVDHAAVLDPSIETQISAWGETAECLILSGRPIGEPVAQHGPFVMNDRAGIEQAFRDYQATGFGGWPWPADDPVHGPRPERFTLRNGERELPEG